MKNKEKKDVLYEGLGFPIQLVHVPMMKTRGEWTPDINYNDLQQDVLIALASKSRSLTGNEIKFIRKYFKVTLQSFGRLFGVSHVAVMEWEKTGNSPARVSPATEKCIRMYVLDALGVSDQEFRQTYHLLKINELADQQKAAKGDVVDAPLVLDCQEIHFGLRQQAVG